MIHQFVLHLTAADDSRLPWSSAYRLYAWLLEQLSTETAETFHEPNVHLLSQFLQSGSAAGQAVWTVNVFADAVAEEIAAVLHRTEKITLRDMAPLQAVLQREQTMQAQDLVRHDERPADRYSTLRFLTPTAFKQAGRYAIYPQEALIKSARVSSEDFCGTKRHGTAADDVLADEALYQLFSDGHNYQSRREAEVELFIPKFNVYQQTDLSSVLRHAGITDAFDSERAYIYAVTGPDGSILFAGMVRDLP